MTATQTAERETSSFANFGTAFVAYMGVATVLAGIPYFVSLSEQFPMYKSMRLTLGPITSFLSFLVIAVLYYYRWAFARTLLPRKLLRRPKAAVILGPLPLIFVVVAAACLFAYYVLMDRSLAVARTDHYLNALAYETWADTATGVPRSPVTPADSASALRAARRAISRGYPSMDAAVLDKMPASVVVHRYALTFLYLGMFLLAEAALVIMALREYLQKQMKLTEQEGIWREVPPPGSGGGKASTPDASTTAPAMAGEKTPASPSTPPPAATSQTGDEEGGR